MKKIVLGLFLMTMLVGCSEGTKEVTEEKWEDNSPTFSTEHGEMFGKEGSIGIIGIKTVTENGQKWMWHFWGDEDISGKQWEVKAFKQGMEEKINPITFKDNTLTPRGKKINGHARSSVKFPSSGLWKLQVYIDGEFFDEIIVDINQE
ncbi:uncharacterized protein DUF4871 [Cytobacillus firmus]|uniref:Uncharacterized protein DUF4871 n=2 Tax=Cytobacillus TaxID=2675230 RepID=A0A366JG99_CYTFI|nr:MULTISPECIES: DUF4871 domain-containing protein [Cytobacillus]RBP85983.1 uncharacterized protein DUF4871 [Cytobacillus firmus]TDX35087.1 uncharacterized protein DUF4871 [Cytobacillus oceanisediminis]